MKKVFQIVFKNNSEKFECIWYTFALNIWMYLEYFEITPPINLWPNSPKKGKFSRQVLAYA